MNVQAQTNFQKNLNAVLKARGVNQEQLAQSAGVSIPAVSRIRRDLACPSLDFSEKLATALGFQLWQMLMPPLMFSKKYLREEAKST